MELTDTEHCCIRNTQMANRFPTSRHLNGSICSTKYRKRGIDSDTWKRTVPSCKISTVSADNNGLKRFDKLWPRTAYVQLYQILLGVNHQLPINNVCSVMCTIEKYSSKLLCSTYILSYNLGVTPSWKNIEYVLICDTIHNISRIMPFW